MRTHHFSLLILCFITAAGCHTSATEKSTDSARQGNSSDPAAKLNVVCTTAQIADIVENVAGDRVEVASLMGHEIDPHDYIPSPGDVALMNRANVIFYNGLHLEGRMAELLEGMAQKRPVFAVTAGVEKHEPELLRKTTEFAGFYDPHVWFDVRLWTRCVEFVAEKLGEADASHKETYAQGAKAYIAELKDIDRFCREQLGAIDKSRKVLITAHDAFGYLGRAYGLKVHGIQGLSSAEEADLGQIKKLVDLVVERKVKAIFIESSVPPRNVQTILDDVRRRGHPIKIGGELYSDAMGEHGTPEGTYIGMMRHNIETIVKALK